MANNRDQPTTTGTASTSTAGNGFDPVAATQSAIGKRKPLRALFVHEILEMPNRDFILDGFILQNQLVVLFGEPKTYKTFTALDLTYRLACAHTRILGRHTRPTRVLYVSSEGALGMKARVMALWHQYGDAPGFKMIAATVDLRTPNGHTDEITRLAKEHGAELVVIDTLARALAGGDENSAADMGALILNADRIKTEANLSVLLIHHKGHSASWPRGHSSLLGAADAMIRAHKSGDICVWTVDMARDVPEGAKLAFRLVSVELPDADGELTSTLHCEDVDADDLANDIVHPNFNKNSRARRKMGEDLQTEHQGGRASEVEKCILDMIAANGNGARSIDRGRALKEFRARTPDLDPGSAARTFSRALFQMLDRGVFKLMDRNITAVSRGPRPNLIWNFSEERCMHG